MYRNVVWFRVFLVSSVLVLYIGFGDLDRRGSDAGLASPPAHGRLGRPYGTFSTIGAYLIELNTARQYGFHLRGAELEVSHAGQAAQIFPRRHTCIRHVVPWPLEPSNGSLLAGFSIGTATNSFVPPTLAAGRTNATIYTGPETLSSPCGRHRAYEGSTLPLPQQGPTMTLLSM